MNVELIYDADCPNVADTRAQLIRAFARTGVSARWREWDRSSPEAPAHAKDYGSPTILVDGKDVAGVSPQAGTRACRVYSNQSGNLGRVPPLEAICSALGTGASVPKMAVGRWQAAAASFPAVGTALLPKLTCPLCFPAYAAILSALGIEFVDYTPYLLPLTVIFLGVAITVLALQTRRSGNFVALALGVIASISVLFAKFSLESDWLTTGGIIVLVVAIVLGNRTKFAAMPPCPACVAGGDDQPVKAH